MKLKVKLSSTQKFIINVDEQTLGNLKNEIRKFIDGTYNQTVSEPLALSLNGREALSGSDETTLKDLGIVQGDMLTILPPSAASQVNAPKAASSTLSSSSKESSAERISTKMESDQVPCTSSQNTPTTTVRDRGRVTLLELKDGETTPSLENLFETCSPSSASEAVNLLVHLTMLEHKVFHLDNNLETPPTWKEMVATFQYSHDSFPEFKCTITLVTMGEVKQILASFPKQKSSITLQINIGDYVSNNSKSVIKTSNLVKVSQLSRILRDHILHPLQVAAHEILGIPAPWHLAGLPHEILLIIASSMDARSVLNVGSSCKRLQSAMEDNKLWRNLYKRDFKSLYSSMNSYDNINWKAKYREAHEREKVWIGMHDDGMEFVIPGMVPPRPPFGPPYPSVPYPELPRPRGPNPYPPQPHPTPNPFADPDGPYFGGDIPHPPNPFPNLADPFDPYGMMPGRPNRGGGGLFQPPFMPPRPRNPRGPRFDFF